MQAIKNSVPNPRRYHSFLLRIWRDDEATPWRIQIEYPHTDEVIGFNSLAIFKQFLDKQFPAEGDETIETTSADPIPNQFIK